MEGSVIKKMYYQIIPVNNEEFQRKKERGEIEKMTSEEIKKLIPYTISSSIIGEFYKEEKNTFYVKSYSFITLPFPINNNEPKIYKIKIEIKTDEEKEDK